MFKDEAEIYVKSGDGGRGCVSFRHETYAPRGGPDGGNGGRGGDVIIRAVANCRTLLDLVRKRRYAASNGKAGQSTNCKGKAGRTLIVRVPLGTIIKDENGRVIADLVEEKQEIVIVKGGRGGFGNAHFACSTNQTPRNAEMGEPGEQKHLFLELKLIADIGLVGFPNAGKSTLLSRVSAARPKIAPYPFTTLEPNLGIVEFSWDQRLVMADIPGLIEGAHDGVGLGIQFLRHIERTKALLYLLDIAPPDGSNPADAFRTLRQELGCYSPILLGKPFLVVANKMDLTDATDHLAQLQEELKLPVLAISAVTGQGINELIQAIAQIALTTAKNMQSQTITSNSPT